MQPVVAVSVPSPASMKPSSPADRAIWTSSRSCGGCGPTSSWSTRTAPRLTSASWCRAWASSTWRFPRTPHDGLASRSTTQLRTVDRLSYRLDLAGGWLDQPFVSRHHPGSVSRRWNSTSVAAWPPAPGARPCACGAIACRWKRLASWPTCFSVATTRPEPRKFPAPRTPSA